eukprot:TRINITY_DN7267_c1_g1_i1.p1 TRINITY_DN7267_c1_g1~~TRINITY_DN7267_c1_g1_i1.p1  ORF type:complete len:379 (+),score=23.08 TRINITY_DN7267_c1_g1_i1:66-1202(+)
MQLQYRQNTNFRAQTALCSRVLHIKRRWKRTNHIISAQWTVAERKALAERNAVASILIRETQYNYLEYVIGPMTSSPHKRLFEVWDSLSSERQEECGQFVNEFCRAAFGNKKQESICLAQGAILRNPDILQRFSVAQFKELCEIIQLQKKKQLLNTAALYAFSGKTKDEFEQDDFNVGMLIMQRIFFLQYNYLEMKTLLAQFAGRQLNQDTVEKLIHTSFNSYGHLEVKVVQRIGKNWDFLLQNGVTNEQMLELSENWEDLRLYKVDLTNRAQKMKICFLEKLVQISIFSALQLYPRFFEVSLERLGQRYTYLKSFGLANQFNQHFQWCVYGDDERFCQIMQILYHEFERFVSTEWVDSYKHSFDKQMEELYIQMFGK